MLILVSGSTATVKRRRDEFRDNLGVLLTPANGNSVSSVVSLGMPWAIDNGAFSGFDPDAFTRLIDRARGQPGLLWAVCPDVVGSARSTLALWPRWSEQIRARGLPVAFVLQDGQEDLGLPAADAYFVGGSTEFKLGRAAADIVTGLKECGATVHMGRVNSYRRLRYAFDLGCDSVDGSSLSMFGDKYIHTFCRWARQLGEQGTLFAAESQGGSVHVATDGVGAAGGS